MKTKPFDLKAALAGAKTVTKSGSAVTNLRLSPAGGLPHPLSGDVEGKGWRLTWTKVGKYLHSTWENEDDLVLVDDIPDRLLPFNLEAALKGESVVTSEGTPVTQVVRFSDLSHSYTVRAVLNREVASWTEAGKFFHTGEFSDKDLFMVAPEPKTHVFWVNLYPNEVPGIHGSEGTANDYADKNRIGKARRIEIPETEE